MMRIKFVKMGRSRYELAELYGDQVILAKAHQLVRGGFGPQIDGQGFMPTSMDSPHAHFMAIQEHAHETVVEESKSTEGE